VPASPGDLLHSRQQPERDRSDPGHESSKDRPNRPRCIQGDSIPQQFIPQLIDLHRAGKLPVERLVTFYNFTDINQAIADSIAGKTIKPVLRMQE